MPRYIVKLNDPKTKKDYYMEWSTVVDTPVTNGMSLEEFNEYYKNEYGNQGMEKLPERMVRVEETGCSARFDDVDGLIYCNRAGGGEKHLSRNEILENYCRNRK